MTGTIKRLTKDKGFGFIHAQDGRDYFFHRSELTGAIRFEQLREGDAVAFEPLQTDKGPRATQVGPVEHAV